MVSMHFQTVTQYPVMPFQYPHCPGFSLLYPVFKTSKPLTVAFAGSSEAFQLCLSVSKAFDLNVFSHYFGVLDDN